MGLFKNFTNRRDKPDPQEQLLLHFLTNLLEKAPFNQVFSSKIERANDVSTSIQLVIEYMESLDSKLNIKTLASYIKDPGIPDNVFLSLYRRDKDTFKSRADIVNYMTARMAQELLFQNYFPQLHSITIESLSPSQITQLTSEPESLKASLKNTLKELIKNNPDYNSLFDALCKYIKPILERKI